MNPHIFCIDRIKPNLKLGVLFFTIGFLSLTNHSTASYLICLKANGDVGVESSGSNGHCASHRGLHQENYQKSAQPCADILLFLNAGDALNSASTYKLNLYLSQVMGRDQPFPQIVNGFKIVSNVLRKTRPVNLALLTLRKTVLLN